MASSERDATMMRSFTRERGAIPPHAASPHFVPLPEALVSRSSSPIRRAALLVVALALPASVACYQDPQEQLDQMQQITDMVDAVNEIGMRTTELQFTVDSLVGVIARQDTTISRLANLAGVPYNR
jgi:uncharacterized protein HemX